MEPIAPIAVEIVRGRKRPSHPEYLESNCPMLNFIAAWGATIHGFSTTMMLSMFEGSFLAAKLSPSELSKLLCFVYTGTPSHRSAFDGGGGMQPVDASELRQVGPYIDGLVDGSVSVPWASEPLMSGFDVFEDTEFDVLAPAPVSRPPPVEVAESPALSGTDAVTDCRKARRRDRVPWTSNEDAFVLDFYNLHGGQWRKMARMMLVATNCARSDDALRNRYSRLTSTCDAVISSSSLDSHPFRFAGVRVPWTSAEDAIIVATLMKWNGRVTWTRIARKLPGRTPHAIRNRAHRLACSV